MTHVTTTEDSPDRFIKRSSEQKEGQQKWLILMAVGIGTFMSALDGSVVNTILPVLRKSVSGSIASVEWIVTIYLLVLSGLLLSVGRLGDMQGYKKVYVSGFIVFIAGSILCGFAPTISTLVIFRGLQALGAAMLQANSPAILTSSFPTQQRGQALGLQAMMTYLGLTVGPSLGGWLTDQFGWRSVFFINIPVGIIALILSVRFIRKDALNAKREPFDYAGASLFTVGLITLLYGLNQGHALGWNSWPVLLSFFGAIALITGFIFVESKSSKPMLDLRLFKDRIFSSSVISAILNYIGVYSVVFLMPFFLIQGMDLSASKSGLILTAMPIVMAITAPISGLISDRVGARLPSTLGMISFTAGLVLLSQLDVQSSIQDIIWRLGLAGFGIGVFISPNTSALLGAAPKNWRGIASGILATSRNLGMVLGVGLAGAIFTTSLGADQNLTGEAISQAVRSSLLAAAIATGIGVFFTSLHVHKQQ